MKSTCSTGNRSQAEVLTALLRAGYVVSLPFGDGHPYDFVVDDGKNMHRIQCKTGRLRNGAVRFNTASTLGARGGLLSRRGYIGRADLFAVFCQATGGTYLIAVASTPKAQCNIRVAPSLNGQQRLVRLGEECALKPLERLSA